MIKLTKFSGETFTLNIFLIEQIQSFPDTTITLTNGKKIVVKDSEADIAERVNALYQHIGLIGSLNEMGEKCE